MNILFITNRFIYPPFKGDKRRIYNLAKRLSKHHNLFLATFISDKNERKYIPELKDIFKKIEVVYLPKYLSFLRCAFKLFSSHPYQVIYFESNKLKQIVKRFAEENKIDVIHVQHLRMAQYCIDLENIPRILDLPDAYLLTWDRRLSVEKNVFKRAFAKIEKDKIEKYEKQVFRKFELLLVCSIEDKEFLQKHYGCNNIELLYNSIDVDSLSEYSSDYSIDDRVIYAGYMSYQANVDAVQYFVSDIFPLILNKLPKVKLYIAGQKPPRTVRRLKSNNVIVTGMVEDLNKYYTNSCVTVSPLRIGAGTQFKVLESMALGVPVVCTSVGFRGLEIKNGDGIYSTDDRVEFSNHVIRLLQNYNLRRMMGLRAKQIIKEKFSSNMVANTLEAYCKGLTNHKKIIK
jgi:sugar transferase (PEP-CTERM/EpsH1 system associated)